MKTISITLLLVIMVGCSKGKEDPAPQKVSLGDRMEGGYVFYIDSTGKHGLIVAEKDLPQRLMWQSCPANIAGTSMEVGTGKANTEIIVTAIKRGSCANTELAAALACDDLVIEGHSDWFLPSWKEMATLRQFLFDYRDKTQAYILSMDFYWTSTQVDASRAYFYPGSNASAFGIYDRDKTDYWAVRPMRAF